MCFVPASFWKPLMVYIIGLTMLHKEGIPGGTRGVYRSHLCATFSIKDEDCLPKNLKRARFSSLPFIDQIYDWKKNLIKGEQYSFNWDLFLLHWLYFAGACYHNGENLCFDCFLVFTVELALLLPSMREIKEIKTTELTQCELSASCLILCSWLKHSRGASFMGSVAIPFSRIWLLSGVCTLRMMGDDSPYPKL